MQLSMGGPASALAHLSIWSFHSLSQRFNSTPFHYPTDPVCLTKREREKLPVFVYTVQQLTAGAAIVTDLCTSRCAVLLPPILLFPF
ncbi:hypothetical protein BDA96_10G180700 [Sorghum bicolor]|uniref:Uncharacterized protein n=1 Tax=Sorghum bicolor TaxID=4558 RepID=A0A921Q4N7_SORBI|nr:hypothetical protein BDA96_10G180700 [Sorghum bicolor]